MNDGAGSRRAAAAAVIAAGATVGFQLAGKATRDALFLSTFGVALLPRMLVTAAVFSAALTLGLTRVMTRTGPGRLVPRLFALSGTLLLLEWGLAGPARPAAAFLFYLHYAGLGALLVSGLWAMVNERFDPRTARSAIGRVATGASVGGLLGGILPERVGASLGLTAMLPILAVLHFVAGWLLLGLKQSAAAAPAPAGAPRPLSSAASVFKASSYLRGLALLVALAAAAEGTLDYVFKVRLAAAAPDGAQLLRLFAAFYTATAVLTILAQVTLLRPLLTRFGVARTAALLPGGVMAGSLSGVMFPGIGMLVAARGLEVVLRNSLFRAAYELLFTPVAPEEKRATKLLLDVGATRVGDAAGGALVQGAIITGQASAPILLGLTGALALAAMAVARQLHFGYVGALERSLHLRSEGLAGRDSDGGTTLLQSFGAFDLTDLRRAPPDPAADRDGPPTPVTIVSPGPSAPVSAAELRQLALALSDPVAVREALRAGPLPPELIEPVIGLLAWDDVVHDAVLALRAVAPGAMLTLVSHLLDPEEDFAVRRRLVSVLAPVPGEAAMTGLLAALEDARFEVRYRAGRALAARRATDPALDRNQILAIVLREVAVERGVWESRQLIDQADDDWSPTESEVVRDRATRSLEHVFNLLSLVLSPDPLRLAFHSLHTEDRQLRGTALEYLETVLPDPVRQRLWPFLESEARAPAPRRSAEQILHELLASRESIVLALAAARRKSGE